MSDRQIVHDLAARGPLTRAEHPISAGLQCRECNVIDGSPVITTQAAPIYQPSFHRPDCIWKRAMEAEEGRR